MLHTSKSWISHPIQHTYIQPPEAPPPTSYLARSPESLFWCSVIHRKYKGNTKEIQRKSKGNTKEIQRKHKGNAKEMQRKYKGSTKEISRKYNGKHFGFLVPRKQAKPRKMKQSGARSAPGSFFGAFGAQKARKP